MTLFNYLQLQPVDPRDDGTVSELDAIAEDDVIDLTQETSEQEIVERLDEMLEDIHSDDITESLAGPVDHQ